MSKRFNEVFDEQFSEPVVFDYDAIYLSRNVYPDKESAIQVLKKHYEGIGKECEPQMLRIEIKEAYIRYQKTPLDEQDELGEWCWAVCDKEKRGAKPCWVHGD